MRRIFKVEKTLLKNEIQNDISTKQEKERDSLEEIDRLLADLDANLRRLGFEGINFDNSDKNEPNHNSTDDNPELSNSDEENEKTKPSRLKKAIGAVAIYSKNKFDRLKNKFSGYKEKSNDNKKEKKNKFKRAIVGLGVAAVAITGAMALKDTSSMESISTAAYTVAHNPESLLNLHGNLGAQQSIDSLKDIDPNHHTDVIIGGAGDKNSNFSGTEVLNNNTDQVRIKYPAGIRPAGDATFNESVQFGSDRAAEAVQGAIDKGDSVNVGGYSLGSEVLAETMDKIAKSNDGKIPENVNTIFFGGPGTPNTGFFNGETYESVKPIADQMDVTPSPSYPEGSHAFARTTDFWANSGNQEITTQLSQLVGLTGDGHAITPEDIADTSRQVVNNVNGVDVHSIHPEGTQTAALRVAEQHGMYVSPEADAFGQAIAPQGEVGVKSEGIDWNQVRDSGANLIDRIAADNNLQSPNASEFVAHDNTDWNQIISPHALDATPEMNQQINQVAQGIAEGMSQNSNGNVVNSIPSISTEQFNNAVQQVQNGVNPAPAPLPNVENFQIPQVNPTQVQNDFNNFVNSFK